MLIDVPADLVAEPCAAPAPLVIPGQPASDSDALAEAVSEQVAMTLGCTRNQAFWRVVLPEAGHGMLAAFTLGTKNWSTRRLPRAVPEAVPAPAPVPATVTVTANQSKVESDALRPAPIRAATHWGG